MSKIPEEQFNTNETHAKNSDGLEITKENLKRELDSLMDLITPEPEDRSDFTNSPNSHAQTMVSRGEFIKLIESNRELQSEVDTLKISITNLGQEINTLRENIRILIAEQPDVSLYEDQIVGLKEAIRNLEKVNHPQTERILEEIPEEPHAFDDTIIVESNVQKVSEISIEKIDLDNEKVDLDPEKIIQETRRRRCPTCNNGNQRYIRELTDKSNVIMQSPRIYGKMYKCGICTTEWK